MTKRFFQQLSAIIELLPDATFAVDPDCTVVAWNRAAEELTGVKKESVLGTREYACAFHGTQRTMLVDLLAAPDPHIERTYEGFRRTDDSVSGEVFLPAVRGGQGAFLWGTASHLYDRTGRRVGAIETVRDISEKKSIEQKLQDEHWFNETILNNNARVWLMVLDPDGVVQVWNRAAAEISGYTAEEVRGSGSVWELLYPDPAYRSRVLEISTGRIPDPGAIGDFETVIQCRDGREREMVWSVQRIPAGTGAACRFILIGIEVTDRRCAERILQESEEQLRSVFENASVGISLMDRDGFILAANQATHRFLGYRRGELVGRTYTDLSHPADLSIDEGLCASVFDGRIPHSVIEKRFLRRDGSVVWGRVGLSLARNTDGSPLYAIAVSEDISERKKHEAALKASEEKYRRLVELAEEGIWATDAQGFSTFVNPKMAGMLGYAAHEITGRPLLSFVDEHDRDVARAILDQRRCGVTTDHDFTFVRRDGSRIYTRVATAPITDDSGWTAGTLSVIVDITDRRRAEEDIRKSLSEKEILLREIHHRVKNNMQVISSLFNLQAREITDEVMVRVFRKSQSRIKSMALVHEKLYQSNNLAEIDFLDYLNSLLMYLVQQFERRGVTCTVDAEALFLNADMSIPLGLIITELVTNALRHAFPGDCGGTIVIGLHHTGDNGTIRLTVKDNGIGVPEGIDVDTASTLGLKLVHSLVRQINGTITVARDNGTMCTVTFHP